MSEVCLEVYGKNNRPKAIFRLRRHINKKKLKKNFRLKHRVGTRYKLNKFKFLQAIISNHFEMR